MIVVVVVVVVVSVVVRMLWVHAVVQVREARIYSSRPVITWLGRCAALVFLQIFPIFAAKAPCILSQPKRYGPTLN